MARVIVSVAYYTDTNGNITPQSVKWCDGRQWDITKVLYSCRTTEYSDLRYTVSISGRLRFLFFDDKNWYVTI